MRQMYLVAFIALMTMYCNVFAQTYFDEPPSQDPSGDYVANQVVWQVKAGIEVPIFDADDDVPQEKLNQVAGLAAVVVNFQVNQIEKSFKHWQKDDELGRTYTVHFEDNEDAANLLKSLDGLAATNLAEYIPQANLFLTPNDPDYVGDDGIPGPTDLQFYLDNINAPTAWDIETCSEPVVIAIVDDAVLTTHEDLIDNLWTNPGEIAGNGVDDDGNGYVDDLNGWDVADNDNDPKPPSDAVSNPDFSHGTHVAGIAAATTNNGIGMASMGYNCLIMPVKVVEDDDDTPATFSILDGYDGVLYAIQSGADVINMSWGHQNFSSIGSMVIHQAIDAGIVCVAAVGNAGEYGAFRPARYPGVIGVGATQGMNSDEIAPFSNYGFGVDVMAPGVSIWSTIATGNNHYANSFQDDDGNVFPWSGTSMASPMVAGLAGLYLCLHGDDPNTNPITVGLCIQETALDIDAQNPDINQNFLPGLLQADEALGCTPYEVSNCLTDNCNLLPNGDFETPFLTTTDTYDSQNPFEEYEVCEWHAAWGTPHLFSRFVSDENQLRMWSHTGESGFFYSEGIITVEPLNLVTGNEYTLSYNFAVVNAPVTVDFRLVEEHITTLGSGELIHQIGDEPIVATNFDIWGDDLDFDDLSEEAINFTAYSDNLYLLIYVSSTEQLDGSDSTPSILLDNISIQPFLDIDAWAEDPVICLGDVTELHVVTIGGETVLWEPADYLSDPTSFNPTANPPVTTEYTVTATDEETGCTVSTEVLVVVDDCPPKCDDVLTVETFCDENGVTLTALLNGNPIDLSSTYPFYTISWQDASGGIIEGQTMVTYPWGTAYNVDVTVGYDIDNPDIVHCQYQDQGTATGNLDLDLGITASADIICYNSTCSQLSVNVPPGFIVEWTPTAGLDNPNSATPLACPSVTTTYFATVSLPNSHCSVTESITIQVEDCPCDDIDIQVVEECAGYETVTKVLVDGLALDPSVLPWIDIDWYILDNGSLVDIIYDQNCMTFPVGTEYVAYVSWGDDCVHQISYEQVKHPDCINCEFSVVETCNKEGVQLTMVDAVGNQMPTGTIGNYTFSVVWLYNMTSYPGNPMPINIPVGSAYGAILTITTVEGEVVCTENFDGIVQGCFCPDDFGFEFWDLNYLQGEDIQLNWHAEGAVSYVVTVDHNYVDCAPETCQFNLTADEGFTSISLADEGCFFTCQEYNITLTAICPDGTTVQEVIPEFFTTPVLGECQECDNGNGGGNGSDDTGGGKSGKRTFSPISTDVAIYPNPTQNHFSLQFDSVVEQAQIELFDLSGKQVDRQEVNKVSQTVVDVSELEPAVYLVKISIKAQEPIFRKLVIVK